LTILVLLKSRAVLNLKGDSNETSNR